MTQAPAIAPELLGHRWTEFRFHEKQAALWHSDARFVVVEAGRRSGKSEIAKRRGVREWICAPPDISDYWVAFCAPTRDQAKGIYWEDLKALVPKDLVESVSESHLTITGKHGARLSVVGMDKPARIEGRPLDWVGLDEFADMKPTVWERHVRPALSTGGRPGRAWIYGVPRPSGQFKKIADEAKKDETGEWAYFHWTAKDIIPEEAEAAKRTMDPLLWAQEYEASRVALGNRAYYSFEVDGNVGDVEYNPRAPLIVCFDFNVEPGVAVLVQEQPDERTAVVDEVYVPRHSNTPIVCREILEAYGDHQGRVFGYGDATGGARGTTAVMGSDWATIDNILGRHFDENWRNYARRSNPPERVRVNAMNARCQTADGERHLVVDPKAEYLIEDFLSVQVLEGTSGELDKKTDLSTTHLTDALGYYVEQEFPAVSRDIDSDPFE